MQKSYTDLDFGKQALAAGLIIPEQLSECLRLQKTLHTQGRYYSLEQICLRKKYLNSNQIEDLRRSLKENLIYSDVATTPTKQYEETQKRHTTNRPVSLPDDTMVLDSSSSQEIPSGGEVSFGRYLIQKELGRGGMGVVYQAYDQQLSREVALKVLTPQGGLTEKDHMRFAREAQAIAKLHHPHIITLFDVGQHESRSYFTMELIAGVSLKEALKKGRITTKQSVEIIIKVAQGLEHAHRQGVIHRDIKPDNIMLAKDLSPKVMDFGLAKLSKESTKLSQSGTVLGTVKYMPPEQAEGKRREVDQRSDIYALGATFYEMLTGRTPFSGNSFNELLQQIVKTHPIPPTEIRSRIPKQLEAICLKALEKQPTKRYQTAREFWQDLERYQKGKKVNAQSKWKMVEKTKQTLQTPFAITFGVILAIIAVFAWSLAPASEPSSFPREQNLTKPSLSLEQSIQIVSPRRFAKQSEIRYPSSYHTLTLSGRIDKQTPVSIVLLQQNSISWKKDQHTFQGSLPLEEGKNSIELAILTEDGKWFKKNWTVYREPKKSQPMFRGNARRTGNYDAAAIKKKPRSLWYVKVKGKIKASPIIAGDLVYIGCYDGVLYAGNKNIGKPVWHFKTGDFIYSTPAIEDGLIYFGSADGYFYALNAQNGQLVWKYQTQGKVLSSPVIEDGVFYCGSHDNYIYALDAKKGTLLWRYQTQGWVLSSPALADGLLYVGSRDHFLYCLDAKKGQLRWKFEAQKMVKSTPAISENRVFFGSFDHYIYAVDKDTGKLLWKYQTNGEIHSSPCLANDLLYIPSNDQIMYALTKEEGIVKWTYRTNATVLASPILAQNVLYFGSFDKKLYALDAQNGQVLWSILTSHPIYTSPIIEQQIIYTSTLDGRFYALQEK